MSISGVSGLGNHWGHPILALNDGSLDCFQPAYTTATHFSLVER